MTLAKRQGNGLLKSLIRKDIQGLRAVAVLAVVLYHALPAAMPGGFIGVDVFFVISGFVITNTIQRDITQNRFSIAQFYRRRIRRIFPALYLMIAVIFAASWFLVSPNALYELGRTALATTFFSSNLYFLRHSNYFDGESALKPLLHTWSLSVEEQFYVLYPIFVLLVRRYRQKLLLPLLWVSAVLSLALSMWMLHRNSSAAFYLAPSRAFELLLGGIVSVAPPFPGQTRWVRNALSLVGLALIAGPLAFYTQYTSFPGIAALPPCLGAALIIWVDIGTESITGKLLSSAPFVFFGDMSYSLYLWHWPILVLARERYGTDLSLPIIAGCVVSAMVAAFLSLHLVERPILAERLKNLPFLRIGALTMAASTAVSVALILAHGVPRRFSTPARTLFAATDDYNHLRDQCHTQDSAPISYDHDCIFGTPGVKPTVAVWGDSHGAELVVALGERLKQLGESAIEITASACPPSVDFQPIGRPYCEPHNQETLQRLIADKGLKTVVLTAQFTRYKDSDFNSFLNGYLSVVTQLRDAGKQLIIVYPIPTQNFDPPSQLGMNLTRGRSIVGLGLPERQYLADNQRAIAFLDAIPSSARVHKIYPEKLYCDQEICGVYAPSTGVLYFNAEHLSLTGARILAGAIPIS